MSVLRALLAMLALAIPSIAVAAPSDRVRIEWLIRRVVSAEEARDRGGILEAAWPEGHFIVFDPDRPTFRSLTEWRHFAFGGANVYRRTTLGRPRISIRGSRALATFTERTLLFYDDQFSGMYTNSNSRVELERRMGEWRVLNWHRSGRWQGEDARRPRGQP